MLKKHKSYPKKLISTVILLLALILCAGGCKEEDTTSQKRDPSSTESSDIFDGGEIEHQEEIYFEETDDVTLYEDEYLFDDTEPVEYQFEE